MAVPSELYKRFEVLEKEVSAIKESLAGFSKALDDVKKLIEKQPSKAKK